MKHIILSSNGVNPMNVIASWHFLTPKSSFSEPIETAIAGYDISSTALHSTARLLSFSSFCQILLHRDSNELFCNGTPSQTTESHEQGTGLVASHCALLIRIDACMARSLEPTTVPSTATKPLQFSCLSRLRRIAMRVRGAPFPASDTVLMASASPRLVSSHRCGPYEGSSCSGRL